MPSDNLSILRLFLISFDFLDFQNFLAFFILQIRGGRAGGRGGGRGARLGFSSWQINNYKHIILKILVVSFKLVFT